MASRALRNAGTVHWCERRGSRRHGLLGRREDVACGRRTRYVRGTLDSEVHPSCVHGLKHFFGRSGVALRDAELLERFRPPCTRDCKGFHVEIQDFTNCSATSSAATIEPSSTARCPDHAGPVKRVATSAPMSFVATMVDFRFVGL